MIADEPVTWQMPSGEQRPGRISVGAPTLTAEGSWCCELVLEGLGKPLRAYGASSLQSLVHALGLIGFELHALLSHGGQVLVPEEGTWHPVLASLRELLRAPGTVPRADPALAALDAELAHGD